jgi:hypothetical protein
MIKKIILGCPYTGMRDLEIALRKFDSDVMIINCSEVTSLSTNKIFLDKTKQCIKMVEITSAFIRYPYDMISPHAETYLLREETEFLKSIALLFNDKSINPVISSWAIRNRLYSLTLAKQFGISIPTSAIINSENNIDYLFEKDPLLCKAIGNCFVSENTETISQELLFFLRVEEDDGDIAAIFPASLLNKEKIQNYLSSIPVVFLQEYINDCCEYRGYYVNEEYFFYKREECSLIDKSGASYQKTTFFPPKDFSRNFNKFAKNINLKYICFDLLVKSEKSFVVIDINPYGSLPKYHLHPDPTDALAKTILNPHNSDT